MGTCLSPRRSRDLGFLDWLLGFRAAEFRGDGLILLVVRVSACTVNLPFVVVLAMCQRL